MLNRILIALSCLAVAGCGFTPLYSTQGEAGIRSEIRNVAVAEVEGPPEPARFLSSALRDALPGNQGSSARYQITLELKDQRRAIAVTRSANTTRFDYYLNGAMVLTDTDTGATRRQSFQTIVSYGVVESQYSSLVGREDAVRRAALEMARQIEIDVALYLKGRAPEATGAELPAIIDDDLLGDGGIGQ